jgi:hypothetical protein
MAPSTAVCLVRFSTERSANPLAMASGSGSLCMRISTRSASLKNRWYCCTLSRVSERLNSVSSGPPKSSDNAM